MDGLDVFALVVATWSVSRFVMIGKLWSGSRDRLIGAISRLGDHESAWIRTLARKTVMWLGCVWCLPFTVATFHVLLLEYGEWWGMAWLWIHTVRILAAWMSRVETLIESKIVATQLLIQKAKNENRKVRTP